MPARKTVDTSLNAEPEKKLLWIYLHTSIHVLVPKKRGSGFLKSPYGHHIDPGLDDVRAYKMDNIDMFGLDGSLELCVDTCYYEDPDHAYATRLMTALSEHYKMPFEHISEPLFFQIIDTMRNPRGNIQ